MDVFKSTPGLCMPALLHGALLHYLDSHWVLFSMWLHLCILSVFLWADYFLFFIFYFYFMYSGISHVNPPSVQCCWWTSNDKNPPSSEHTGMKAPPTKSKMKCWIGLKAEYCNMTNERENKNCQPCNLCGCGCGYTHCVTTSVLLMHWDTLWPTVV